MKRVLHFLSIALFAAGIGFGIYAVRDRLFVAFPHLRAIRDGGEVVVETIQREILAPGPLRFAGENPKALLTVPGVIRNTNAERVENGAAPLTENPALSAAASAKLADLFRGQYFEHVGPDGNGPSHWVEGAGYRFIVIGENLALGDYEDDVAVVDAWMASPGHRANILNARFTEIGVAVRKGMFDGRTTWLAVQEFGKPLSECPEPDGAMKASLDVMDAKLGTMRTDISALRAQIDGAKPKTQQQYAEYQRIVDAYNGLVATYNGLLDEIHALSERYNTQIRAFNACIAE